MLRKHIVWTQRIEEEIQSVTFENLDALYLKTNCEKAEKTKNSVLNNPK